MSEWIVISELVVTGLVVIGLMLILVLLIKKKEGKMREPNYQVFFNVGMIWIPVGVVFMITVNQGLGVVFIALGIIYMAISVANKDKWKKKI